MGAVELAWYHEIASGICVRQSWCRISAQDLCEKARSASVVGRKKIKEECAGCYVSNEIGKF